MNSLAKSVIAPKPKTSSWRRQRSSIPLQNMNRQGRITHLAYSLLGERDAAIVFLNTPNAALGATPLDLAGKSAEGYTAVQNEVRRLASALKGEQP